MMIYMDAAATGKFRDDVEPIIIETITGAMRDYWMNPSSLYSANVKNKISECRANIAKFINANPDEIIFTSGSSESNCLAIRGWVDYELNNQEFDDLKYIYLITSPIEHKSISSMIGHVSAITEMCGIDGYGSVNLCLLENTLRTYKGEAVLVSIHMANNEIGTIQDIKKISKLVHEYNGVLHIDATQAFGHIPVNVKEMGIDMMSVSGHKISPVLRGIGFLYKKNGISISPIIYGTQEDGLRGGTENTFGIAGLSKAIELCNMSDEAINDMSRKRDYFIDLLESKFGCKLNGHRTNRLPNNVNVVFPQNITGESLLYTLDLSGCKVSVGSACNSREIKGSHVLKAIGLSDEDAMKTVRFTLPTDITYREIDNVVYEIRKAIMLIET